MATEQVPVMGRLGRFFVLGEGKCNYEKEVYASGVNREIHYLYGGNGLAGIYVRTDGKDTLFAAVTDRQNSLTAVMDVATGKIEKFSYKPWGMRRNPANWSENVVTDYPARFSRGYCMHEHLPQFGLINMGGRVFDERTNQFLSADPYRQAPESWLSCNRFGYCMGNPVMYTDPEGEWLVVDDIIAMFIGGLVNGFSQLASGNVENFGQFMSYVGVGAVGAEVSLYASPIVGGMIVGGGNAALNGVFSGNGISAQNVLMGAFMGGLTSYVGGQVSGWVSNATSSLMGNVMSPALRYITPQAIGGATSGFAVGFAFSLGLGADFKTALKEGGKGALFGFTTGVFHGLHETRIYSKEHDVNPWTGKSNVLSKPGNLVKDEGGSYSVYVGRDPETGEVKYVGITKRTPQQRWNEHLNSGTPRATLDYQLVSKNSTGLSQINARIWEQDLINYYKLDNLYNQINSIAPSKWPQFNIKSW